MDLLYSRAIPGPEFVSLSILLRNDTAGGDATPISYHIGGGGEPLLLSGSLSTVSQFSCLEALTELHFYINSILKATVSKNCKKTNDSNSATKNTTTAGRFLKEDEKFLFADKNSIDFVTQIFRPKKCHGIAMQYHLIRDRKQLSSFLVPLILGSSKLHSSKTNNAAAAPTAGFEMKEVAGVIFCVGMGGGPSAAFGVGTSPLTYSLSHRMKKCLYLLCGQAATEPSDANIKRRNTGLNLASARSLLTTLLLTDDEDRIVNSVVNGEQRIEINQEDQFTRRMSTINLKRRSHQQGIGGGGDGESPLQASSADQARIIVERLAILSVFDTDSILRKFENRKAARYTASTGKSGKKRLRKFAKDADLDGFDFRGEKRSSSTSNLDRNATNNSSGKVGGVDDVSVSARSTFTNTSNLTLKGPKKDTASRTSINRSRQPTTPGLLASSSKDSNSISRTGGRRNMHGRRSSIEQESLERNLSSSFVSPLRTPQGSVTSRNYQNQGLQHFDPFSGDSTDTGPSGGGTITKALINIALNEDLTCFYKVSKLSSCSVEGVIQVQARSNIDRGVPFSLLIRDPSKCIQSIQENKKYAEISTEHNTKSDYAFAVSVPKADEYFPVMRYKCGNELRPVPIVSVVFS